MSETPPNSKAPAPVQMTPEMAASLGVTPAPEATATTEPTKIPASAVSPEDICALAIQYRDGEAVLIASGGKYLWTALPVVDGSGNAVAAYAALRDTQDTTGTGAEKFRLGTSESPLIPTIEGEPENIATLSLRHVDGQPQPHIVASGGTAIRSRIRVVTGSGQVLAEYRAGTYLPEDNAHLEGLVEFTEAHSKPSSIRPPLREEPFSEEASSED
ncbi:hypothetical protein ACFVVP_26980 [Streptomyces sp. NPDC058128]|uniref:hypothetical protein n=1 Tax=Streptomyces sp. NPDC058128 TaxID=3346352 RepID=UPI0036E7EB22